MAHSVKSAVTGVDTHAHIFRTDLPMTAERRYAPEYNALPEDYLAQLDAHNMSHGVLVQPSFLGTDNNYLLAALRNNPDRLRGIAVVDIAISDAELDELADAGVVGIRLNLIKKPLEDYTSPAWRQLLSKLEKRGWQIEIQREIEDLATIIPPMIEAGVSVVVDHFGRTLNGIQPEIASHKQFLDLLPSAPVWTKISGAYRCNATLTDAQIMLATLRSAYGNSNKLLWGSDWPNTQFENVANYDNQYEFMQGLLTDEEERNQVLTQNPIELFKF